ncbi:hypothetical protein [Brochothrix thermosphacta]|uniref:hypothetical protein n=2 Tax=Listeriaceae TaxID=186820 RepID=UPI001472138B|nr:hypothetical protein [Brochothrix thermosphacta]
MQLKVFYWALMAILFTIVAWLNTEPFYRWIAITWVVICIVYIFVLIRNYHRTKNAPSKTEDASE